MESQSCPAWQPFLVLEGIHFHPVHYGMTCARSVKEFLHVDIRSLETASFCFCNKQKLETRTLVSKMLSGLIKVLPPDLLAGVKSEILKEALVGFPTQKSASVPASVVQLHSCVLKLASFLQSHSYELADWCAPPTVVFCTLCDNQRSSVSQQCMNPGTSYGSALLQSTRSYGLQLSVSSRSACTHELESYSCPGSLGLTFIPINSACRRVHAFVHMHPSMMGSRRCSG
jgi:hypothetical protein